MLLSLLLLLLVIQSALGSRAPDTQDPDVPDVSKWCGDKTLGTPTRTTGECICKYGCEGRCTRSQGFNFYAWREGVSGAARCLPPVARTEEEKEQARTARRVENERLTMERMRAKSRDPEAEGNDAQAKEESAFMIWYRETLDDLEFLLPNIIVATIVSALFGTVLFCMVIMNAQTVKNDLSSPSPMPAATKKGKGGGKDD